MSDVTKLSAMFILSLCMTLTACGGGGGGGSDGGSDGGDVVDSGGDTGDGDGDVDDGGGDTGGDGGDDGGTDEPVDENAPALTVTSPGMKQLHFAWDAHEGDEYYVLSQRPTSGAGFVEVERVEEGTETSLPNVSVHQHDGADTTFMVEACDAADACVPSAEVSAQDALISAIGYFKASNLDPADEFGQTVALSEDGMTMVVGAHDESSHGADDPADNSVRSAGAVYVFVKGDDGWVQEAYVKASDIAQDDDFGHSVALSADGNTLAVGAPWEEGPATDANDTGAVYVFTRQDGVWTEQGYLHAATPRGSAHFGLSVSLSDDGNMLAVGAHGRQETNRTAEDGTVTTTPAVSGTVHLLTRAEDGSWTEVAELAGTNTEANDFFGYDVALSGDASTLVVGAIHESNSVTDVNSADADNTAAQAGAVYVFGAGDAGWEQQAYLKASTPEAGANFGNAVAIDDSGNMVAVGAPGEGEGEGTGAVHLFSRTEGVWGHQARVLGSNTEEGDRLGADVALADDGSRLAIGATAEDSAAAGVGGDEASDATIGSGAVYVMVSGAEGWTQSAYVKAPNPQEHAMFGHSVALDGTGAALAVGAIGEDGKVAGVGGDPAEMYTEEEVRAADANPVETGAGAVYLY